MAYSSMDWMEKGNCVGVDPDLMFPGRGQNNLTNKAKAVCVGCPVKDECLEFALKEVIQQRGATTCQSRKINKHCNEKETKVWRHSHCTQ